ncbi:MAG: glycoside hydrolase family 130 protein [Saprospiraceae bacterium]
MRLPIERKNVKVLPDVKRVIARYFFNGADRAKEVIKKVMALRDERVFAIISPLLQEYSKRHRNITKILLRNGQKLAELMKTMDIDFEAIDLPKKLLLGSYFTHEYSIESAAFFNPSIVEDPDQSDLEDGERRLIISFRAVGEGHISSIVFRRALIDRNNDITVLPAGDYIVEAEVINNAIYNKKHFINKGIAALISENILAELDGRLGDHFEYQTLKDVISKLQEDDPDPERDREFEKVLWLSDSYYEIIFSMDTDISDRVIFPISEFEKKGIEDARFTKFQNDDGTYTYYATYTAFDGNIIIPKLLKTNDFYDFNVGPLFGASVLNKNLALFPRKINGKYAMLSRIDGINNYIMFSDKINVWETATKIQEPKYSWEFVQVGNCGPPIETSEGWLVITHAVGPMRRYCLSACLLQLDNPSIEIGRLDSPLLVPNMDEREGYVPNVVYSCGSIINNGQVIIPYGLSDYSSSFVAVDLDKLLARLKRNPI